MLKLDIKKLTEYSGGDLFLPEGKSISDYENINATCVVQDSRVVGKNGVFLAIKGEKVDGHRFIPQVFEGGALAVICEQLPDVITGPCVKVDNTVEALQKLAEGYRQQMNVKVVGITGSVGKTSTKEFVASVLEQKFSVLKTEKNFNNLIGLPLMVLKITEETEVAVLEMGISEFGEMEKLSQIARPDVCLITNIGVCHLENLKDRDGVLSAKTRVYDYMNRDGFVVFNGKDDKLLTVSDVYGNKPLFFGEDTQEAYATNVSGKGLLGSNVTINLNIDRPVSFEATVPLPGAHMISNALAASIIGYKLGMDVEDIAKGIKAVQAVGGRSHVIETEKYILIDDCYNANPVSMKAAIDLLKTADGRKVAILGDMFELGENEAALHREVGEYAANQGIEVIVCVGELSKNMRDGALSSLMCEKQEIHYLKEKQDLIKRLPAILEEKDVILIKASHGMGFDEIVTLLSKE